MEAAALSLLVSEDDTASDPAEPEDAEPAEEADAPDADTPDAEEAPDDDTPEDEPEEEEAPETPALYTVKVDGEEKQVTLEELTRSYSGQAYIQRGMQEVAAKRREAESIFNALQSEHQQLTALRQRLATQGLVPPPPPLDPRLAETDPQGYVKALARHNAHKAAYDRQQAELAAVEEQQARVTRAAQDAYLAEQMQALRSDPDFADQDAFARTRDRLWKIGKEVYGFTDDDLGNVMDARAVKVLRDAARYHELKAQKAEAKKPTQAPRHVKPAARRPEPPQLAYARKLEQAKKSGRMEDFVDLLLVPKSSP
jgi:hypothetical protein